MSRLATAFPKDRPAIVAYLMAGDPDATRDHEYARAILREADILEIGVPYSDPVADGPVIERAGVRALARGTKPMDAIALAAKLRADEARKPIVLMTYYNPILQHGLDKFARECADAGVDGIICPDLPLEEGGPLGEALARVGIDHIQLASPATPPERLARLAKATRGFLYVVSAYGITGARRDLAPETKHTIERAKAACAGAAAQRGADAAADASSVSPFAVGFGVSEPAHVRALHEAGAPGVVVGSAIVGRIEKGEAPDVVAAFVRSLHI